MTSWNERIKQIADGEQVDAAHAGAPDRMLEQNLRFLREQLDSVVAGEALVLRDLPCASGVMVGHVVYWDADQQRIDLALAQLVFDADSGSLVASNRSEVIGVVSEKRDSSTVDVIVYGWAAVDLTESAGADAAAGRYFLSDTTAGHLKQQRPSLSLPVLFSAGNGQVLVAPVFRNWDLNHAHYRISLVCRPAGTANAPTVGQAHSISSADDSLPGWLPADHAIFDDLAPANAKFGYNLSQHSELQALWPPFPIGSAVAILDRGENRIGGTEVPTTLLVLDKNGLWWMSDCYDDVPWPGSEDFIDGSESVSIQEPGTCPRQEFMTLAVLFSRVLYDAAQTMVTSITAQTGSMLTVVNGAGAVARTGDLILDVSLNLLLDSAVTQGYSVLKGISNNKFLVGPVAEGLIASGENVLLTSSHPVNIGGGVILHQGRITVGVNLDPTARELSPVTVRVTDTKERFNNGIPYLGFPAGYESSFTALFYVPLAGLPASPKIVFNITLLGTASGTLPDLTITYRRIPKGTGTPQTLPLDDTTLAMPGPGSVSAGNKYVLVELPEIDIAAGDTLLLTVTRAASDSYSAELGVIRPTAVLTQG
jgi:hypothetical protein